MTHLQNLFIKNLRFFRTQKGFSQLAFSEKINVSPNYLNAVENGKNFPSPEVLQKIIDVLGIFPYQLFLENPNPTETLRTEEIEQAVTNLKARMLQVFDDFLAEK